MARVTAPELGQHYLALHRGKGVTVLTETGLTSVAAAGDALIKRLAAEFLRPEYQMRWTWEAGAIAIWDNRLVQHYGVPDQTGDRYLERITVEGGPMLGLADWEAREGVAA